MQNGAALLHTHVMTSAQDLAILGNQDGTDGHAALGSTLLCLFHSSDEAWVLVHGVLGMLSRTEVKERRTTEIGD